MKHFRTDLLAAAFGLRAVSEAMADSFRRFDAVFNALPPHLRQQIEAIEGQDQIDQSIPLALSLIADDLIETQEVRL